MQFALIFQVFAWLAFGVIMLATAVPIGWRPQLMAALHVERILAFSIMGLLFVLAYPGDRRLIALFCILAAVVTELLQAILPSRRPNVEDAAIKILGATMGLLIGGIILQLFVR
ncbi:VanZ family protein [Rhizobium rhizogenes]|uniref:VanZ family protein n=1 Tax=Rhizobium rhizogenes TaxID=359 RepID=UPI000645EF6E|nr:VanZ family protein [Rhizobium rhizogenes]